MKRTTAAEELRTATLPKGQSRRAMALVGGERGAALVELAMSLPVLLMMVTGIFSFGMYLQQNLQLTDAVNVAGKQLAIARGNTTDPCSLVYSAVTTSAPFLTPGSMNFSYTFNGVAYSGSSCSSSSSTTGAAGNLVQGEPVTINVTYPCNLTVYYVVLVSSGTCLNAQITEMVQ